MTWQLRIIFIHSKNFFTMLTTTFTNKLNSINSSAKPNDTNVKQDNTSTTYLINLKINANYDLFILKLIVFLVLYFWFIVFCLFVQGLTLLVKLFFEYPTISLTVFCWYFYEK